MNLNKRLALLEARAAKIGAVGRAADLYLSDPDRRDLVAIVLQVVDPATLLKAEDRQAVIDEADFQGVPVPATWRPALVK